MQIIWLIILNATLVLSGIINDDHKEDDARVMGPVIEDEKRRRIAPDDKVYDQVTGYLNRENKDASHLCNDYHVDLTYDGYRYKPVFARSEELGGVVCRISDFQFGKTLGKGGLGVVKIAKHLPSGRTVAVKIGHPRFGDEHSYIRWRNEECLHHRIYHRYVAQHYCTMVSDDGGDIMLVVELVDGSNLHAVVKKERHALQIKSTREIRRIAAQIALTLEYLHDRGVVMRDVKPGNIMVTRGDLDVRMIDFGLALDLWQDKAYEEKAAKDTFAIERNAQHNANLDRFANDDHVNLDPFPIDDQDLFAVDDQDLFAVDDQNPFAGDNQNPFAVDNIANLGSLLQAPLHRGAFFEEIRRHNQYRPYVDYYGLGVTVYELFTGREYKKAQRERPQNYGDQQMKGFVCVRGMDREACDFIQGITDLDWTRSAQLGEIRRWVRRHRWFRKINWDRI